MNWTHRQIGVIVGPVSPDIAVAIERSEKQTADAINQLLYGHTGVARPRQTFREWLAMWRWRISDAFQVLRGRADIC